MTIKLYFHPSPNPMKVVLCLEEMGLDYEIVPVDTRKGEQHEPAFLRINPNAKTPALTDGDVTVFDSTAILLYLAEKTGKFLPKDKPEDYGQALSWLMFVATGIGPYSGQAVHFKHVAPEPKDYAVNRYTFEAERHWKILDEQISRGQWMVGGAFSIVDMAVWGWARAAPFLFGDSAWTTYPHIKRLVDEIAARPSAARVTAAASRHEFKKDMDDVARRAMFPSNMRLAAAQ